MKCFYHADTCIFFDYTGVSQRVTTQTTIEIIFLTNKQTNRKRYFLSKSLHSIVFFTRYYYDGTKNDNDIKRHRYNYELNPVDRK